VNVPPLRERREDITLLARYFVQKHAQRMGRNIDTIPTSVLDALTNYDWPGNIRELQNVLERSVILTGGNVLQVAMPELIGEAGPIGLYERSPAESPDRRKGNDSEGAGGSKRPDRRSGGRGGSPWTEADDLAIPHAKIQHRTPV
jgi:transcriptional regulator with GAF, ATPase, and Fis domain